MKTRTKASLGALVIAASVLFYSAMPVSAQPEFETEQFNSIIEKIAQKLNLQPETVKAVFEEVHKEKQMMHKEKVETRLSDAVAKGTITEQQKQDLITKFDELGAKMGENREAWMKLSPEDRKAAMETQHTELKAWADEKGISTEVLQNIGIGLGHGWRQGLKTGFWVESR